MLDVEPVPAQPVQDVGEHADPVQVAHGEGGRADPAGGEVDAVGCLALDEGVDHLHHAGGDGVLRLLGRRADVMGADHPRMLREPGGPLGRAGAGLVGVHVEPGAQVLAVEGLEQGVLVDEVTARGVQQHGPGPHLREERSVDQTGRGRAGRQVQGDHVAGREQLGQRVGQADVQVLDAGQAWGAAVGPRQRQDVHPEGPGALGHLEPDRAEPEDAHRRAVEAACGAVRLLVPATRPQVDGRVDDVAVDGEQEAHRQLGDRDGVPPGQVRDQDPARGGGAGVDRVGAGAGPDHQGEAVGVLEDLADDLGAAHHQRVETVEAVRQVRRRQAGLDDAGVAALLELGDRRRADGVGKEHAHRDLRVSQAC